MIHHDHLIPDFYQTAMGRMVRHLIARKLKLVMSAAFPAMSRDLDVAALGYVRPYLKYFNDHYPQMLHLQMVDGLPQPWPASQTVPSRQARVDGHNLPLLDASLDLVLAMHCVEVAPTPHETVDEIWRVLKGQGKLVLMVPHRGSMWVGREDTPFGLGQPYSSNQIKRLLQDRGFDVIKIHQALAAPPSHSRFYTRFAPYVERLPNPMGGVLIVEAVKMIYAVRTDRSPARQKTQLSAANRLAGVKSNSHRDPH